MGLFGRIFGTGAKSRARDAWGQASVMKRELDDAERAMRNIEYHLKRLTREAPGDIPSDAIDKLDTHVRVMRSHVDQMKLHIETLKGHVQELERRMDEAKSAAQSKKAA